MNKRFHVTTKDFYVPHAQADAATTTLLSAIWNAHHKQSAGRSIFKLLMLGKLRSPESPLRLTYRDLIQSVYRFSLQAESEHWRDSTTQLAAHSTSIPVRGAGTLFDPISPEDPIQQTIAFIDDVTLTPPWKFFLIESIRADEDSTCFLIYFVAGPYDLPNLTEAELLVQLDAFRTIWFRTMEQMELQGIVFPDGDNPMEASSNPTLANWQTIVESQPEQWLIASQGQMQRLPLLTYLFGAWPCEAYPMG